MLTNIQDAVKLLLPAKRKTNSASGWISFNAPCCVHHGETADARGRGGLVANPDGGVSYHCFNCNFKASYVPGRHLTYKFRKLLSWLGASENEVKRLVIDAIRVKDLVEIKQAAPAAEQDEVTFEIRSLPEQSKNFVGLASFYKLANWHDCPQHLIDAINYIANRKIDLTKYDFYWTPEFENKLDRRVIIPFYWKKELVGYSARAIVDGISPKYYTQHAPHYVFNTDNQDKDNKFVIVVEGAFDAMSIDGVAILGSECSEQQADIIESLGREVIVVPDFDKHTNKQGKEVWPGASLIDNAVEYGWSVSFPVWAEKAKDVNDAIIKFGKLFVLKSIIDGKESNRLKIELKKKSYAR
jgi:hypothetical protein